MHYFPRGSNTPGNKFGADFSEEEREREEEKGLSPLSPAVEAAAATRVTLLSIIIL